MGRIDLTEAEAQITSDILTMVLNDPDWQEQAAASDAEWDALQRAHAKIAAVT